MKTELLLPFPPSTNNLFENNGRGKGRRKSERYLKWIEEAGWQLRTQKGRINRHTGHVTVTIMLHSPDGRRRDVDNYCKGILDLLVTHQILGDDSLIQCLGLAWTSKVPAAMVVIEDIMPIRLTPDKR